MKKATKLLVCAFAACMALVVIAGCSSSGSGSSSAASASASTASASASASAAAGLPEKVVIGTQNLTNAEALALENGYFDEALAGSTVDVKTFSAGRDLIRAMASGDIDFAIVGSLPVAIGLGQGIDYKVIYTTSMLTNSEALVSKKDSGIKSLSDLPGKKVAVTYTSTCHYSLLNALKSEGIDPNDVDLIDLEPEKMTAAWQRGDIDAGYVWDPARGTMEADGGEVTLTSGDVGKMGYPTCDFVIVRSEFAEQYPDAVVAYMKGIIKAEQEFANDNDAAIAAIAKHFETDEATIKSVMTDTYPSAQEQLGADYLGGGFAKILADMSDFLVEQGEISSPLDLDTASKYVDASFVEKALA